jgi:hypothetical protein
MKHISRFALAYLLFCQVNIYAQQTIIDKPIITFIDGNVRIQKPGSEGWIKVAVNGTIDVSESLKAWGKSKAELKFAQNQFLRIGPLSTVKLDSISPDIVTGVLGNFWLNLNSTDIEFMTKTRISTSAWTIDVMLDSAMSKSIYRITVGNDGSTEIKIYDGQIMVDFTPMPITTKLDKPAIKKDTSKTEEKPQAISKSWSISLGKMQRAIVSSAGTIVEKGSFNPNDSDEQSDWVSWNKARDAGIR